METSKCWEKTILAPLCSLHVLQGTGPGLNLGSEVGDQQLTWAVTSRYFLRLIRQYLWHQLHLLWWYYH